MREAMKATLSFLSIICLLIGCRHPDVPPSMSGSNSYHRISPEELRERMVGRWWYSYYDPEGPFTLLTFSEDGSYTALSTNIPNKQAYSGHWRIDTNGALLLTKEKDALPESMDQMLMLRSWSDNEMDFSPPSVAGQITLRK